MIVVSSRAAERLERAESWLHAHPPDAEVVVVSASLEAANRLCRRAGRAGARFGWHRLTPGSLAARLGTPRLAQEGLAPISSASREALCARVVRSRRGSLGRLEPVAETPGIARALAATLAELRMTGIDDQRIDAIDTDLGMLARAYRALLRESGLADRADVFRAAIEAVADHPLGTKPLLLVDLPIETALEAELLRALAARAPEVVATFPAADERSLGWLREALGGEVERAADAPGSLGRVQSQLFAGEMLPPRDNDESVQLLTSPGEAREAVEIARRILAEAEAGTPFDQMAVLLRSVEGYREPLREAFRRARIPAHFTRGTMRPDPAGRALLSLLACKAERLSAVRFNEYLSLSLVPAQPGEAEQAGWVPPEDELLIGSTEPRAAPPAPPKTLLAPRLWERLIREAAVVGHDLERWRRRLAGLEARLSAELRDAGEPGASDALQARLSALRSLRLFAQPLLEELDALPTEASWASWLAALRKLSRRAIVEPTRVLTVLAELEPLGPIGAVDLDEVRLVLEERLTTLPARESSQPAGKVYVAQAQEARGQRFSLVFAPGLAERVFPPVVREDPLLLDEAREKLDGALVTQRDRVDRERTMLRLIAGAAERRLVISYPRVDDEKARPRVPSFYALEVLRAAEGVLPRFDALSERALPGAASRMGWPAPNEPGEAIDAAEFDLAILGRLLIGDRHARRGAAAFLLDANPHLARTLRFRALRWGPKWGRSDGLAAQSTGAHPRARAALERRRVDPVAPTTLELLSSCPYRFYLRAIVGLSPREEVSELDQLDARLRGQLVHAMQRHILTSLRTSGMLPLSPGREQEILAEADRVIEEVAGGWAEALAPSIERVYRDAIEEIRADLREWLLRLAHDPEWQPAQFELAFGIRLDDEHDPASRAEPVEVAGLRLRGAIDLVERAGERLRATDHKTGANRLRPGFFIDGGRVLQPLLYALVLEELTVGAQVVGGRLSYCTSRGGFSMIDVPVDDEGRAAVRRFAALLDDMFEHSWFPTSPDRGACQHCDYQPVCGPYEEQRITRKDPRRLARLAQLRRER